MKILVDARNLGFQPSGIGIYAYNFIEAITKEDDIIVYVLVDVEESPQIKELINKECVTVIPFGKRVYRSIGVIEYFRFVKRSIERIKPDVFWEVNNFSPVRIRNRYGKYVVTVHDVFPLSMPECFPKYYQYYFKMSAWITSKTVDRIIYDSETSRGEVLTYLPKLANVDSFISYVIIPDVDVDREKVGDGNYFLYIGNLEKRKGTDILLKAYEKYVNIGGSKELVLAGKPREDDIDRLLEDTMKRVKSVKYTGFISEEEKKRLLANCSCFVFPSRAEGFGIPVVEALMYNKQVITSDLPIFEEIVGESVLKFRLDGQEESEKELSKVFFAIEQDADRNRYYNNRFTQQLLGDRLLEFFRTLV